MVQVVEAVKEATPRIMISTPKTFWSRQDIWLYVEIGDDRLCPVCHANAALEGGAYEGHHLRAYFPYLEILDEDTLKVNEHPNCRCVLVRVAKGEQLPKQTIVLECLSDDP